MTTKEHLCELGCGRPAPTTTICPECADHPRKAVNQFTTDEISRLFAIARGEEQPAESMARKNSDHSTIEEVLNLEAFELANQITHVYPRMIEDLPTLPSHRAKRLYWKILGDCEQAQVLINGHQIEWRPEQYDEAYKELSEPKTYDELIEWFWDRLRMQVSYDRLRKWKQRGRITPVDDAPGAPPRFRPRSVLEAMQ